MKAAVHHREDIFAQLLLILILNQSLTIAQLNTGAVLAHFLSFLQSSENASGRLFRIFVHVLD